MPLKDKNHKNNNSIIKCPLGFLKGPKKTGRLPAFATSYMFGREDKRTNNKMMLPTVRKQCSCRLSGFSENRAFGRCRSTVKTKTTKETSASQPNTLLLRQGFSQQGVQASCKRPLFNPLKILQANASRMPSFQFLVQSMLLRAIYK